LLIFFKGNKLTEEAEGSFLASKIKVHPTSLQQKSERKMKLDFVIDFNLL